MLSSGHMDWLAVTFPITVQPNVTLPSSLRQYTWGSPSKGSNGYRTRLSNEIGATLLLNGQERMGIHMVLPGQALADIRRSGVTDHELCCHIVENDGKASRLDLALDLRDGTLTAGIMAQAFQDGRLKTPARSGMRLYSLTDTGETFSLGNRTSERYFRAYNKAAQLGLDEAWLRLELECKKLRARALLTTLADETNTRGVVNHAIGDFIHMPESDELNQALSEQAGELPEQPRQLHNTLKWLIEQVAPAMAHYQAEHTEENVGAILQAAYAAELAKVWHGETNDDAK
jgi:hypothetical protein